MHYRSAPEGTARVIVTIGRDILELDADMVKRHQRRSVAVDTIMAIQTAQPDYKLYSAEQWRAVNAASRVIQNCNRGMRRTTKVIGRVAV